MKADDFHIMHDDELLLKQIEYLRTLCGLSQNVHILSSATRIQNHWRQHTNRRALKVSFLLWKQRYHLRISHASTTIQRAFRRHRDNLPSLTSLFRIIFRLQEKVSKLQLENRFLKAQMKSHRSTRNFFL